MTVRTWKEVARDRLDELINMQVRAEIAEDEVKALQLELADECGAYDSLKEMFDAMIDCGDCQSVAKIKARAEAAEEKVKTLEHDNALAFARIDSLTDGWETINKVLTTAIGLQDALEKAEARVKMLEDRLREIERYCASPADSIARAALAAKEKP